MSKKIIKHMGNVELFELFETDPKTSCKECLLYWSLGICTAPAGISWKKVKPTEAPFNVLWTFFQFQIMSLRRDDFMATDLGKTTEQRDYHVAHNWRKRCIKMHFQGIHHRFVNDPEFRASQLEHDREEEVCIICDDLAEQDFICRMTESECVRYKQNWWISFNKSGDQGPLRKRLNHALSTLNRLHHDIPGPRPT